MRVRLPLRAPTAWGCGARAASRPFTPRIPVRVRASLPEIPPPNALSDEHRPLKPGNQARFLAGAPDLIPRVPSPRPSLQRTVSGPLGRRTILPRSRGAISRRRRLKSGRLWRCKSSRAPLDSGGFAALARCKHGLVAQRQTRRAQNADLVGSNPTESTPAARFFQQQDASLTSRRRGCDSLTGHQNSSGDMGRQRPTCFGNRHRPGASPGSPTKLHPTACSQFLLVWYNGDA